MIENKDYINKDVEDFKKAGIPAFVIIDWMTNRYNAAMNIIAYFLERDITDNLKKEE